ncbi:protein moonraker [Latimeria chalumnae]|nr:PREDICTED: uncharacterized protein KIAA0753 homolog [Latimeria chalumnae]|eukprot:XP_005987557.1 PREDICTED: uncharacterized protein KIAA0753 homolog [Latimeria chalumnae]
MATDIQQHHTQLKFTDPNHPHESWIPSSLGNKFKTSQNKPQLYQTQLKFNREVSTLPDNLAVRFSNPPPIVIEKLSHSHDQKKQDEDDDARSSRSSIAFSVVSEDRLNFAIQMAKRDIRRHRLEEQVKEYVHKLDQSKSKSGQEAQRPRNKALEKTKEGGQAKTDKASRRRHQASQASGVEVTSSGAKVYIYTPDRSQSRPVSLDSPPTHDPGPGAKNEDHKSIQEIRRLRQELGSYIQKIEELAKTDRAEEMLDPDEERRAQTRRKEQAVRSARMLYVLQQQVKEIQEELEKLSPHKIKHTKKTRAMSRLAAAHRGAVRALQLFVTQLTDPSEQQVPAHYKELGHLIRQLSLCSAKLEAGPDSAVPENIIDILQQVEDLDSFLQRKHSPKKLQKSHSRTRSRSPENKERSPAKQHTTSPGKGKTIPSSKEKGPQEQKTSSVAKRLSTDDNQLALEAPKTQQSNSRGPPPCHDRQPEDDPPTPDRNAVLKAGLEALIRAGALKKRTAAESVSSVNKGVLLPERLQGFRQPREMKPTQQARRADHFQQATVASRLKENQPHVKGSSTPWIPPNPTSPPASPKRAPWKKQRVSFKTSRPKSVDNRDQTALLKEIVEKERRSAAEKEAVRLAWLDTEEARRMRELKELCKEEIDKIQKMRSEAGSPSRWADKVEKAVRDRLHPLLDRAQEISDSWEKKTQLKNSSLKYQLSSQAADKVTGSADLLSEKLLDDLLEDTAQELWNIEHDHKLHKDAIGMQDSSTLETMLQRIDEMERYQLSVRRRFNQIVYADPEFWAQEERKDRETVSIDRKSETPRPIRLTKLAGKFEPEMDIVLQRPLNGDAATEFSELEERSELNDDPLWPLTQKLPLAKPGGTVLSVPGKVLQNILDYNQKFEEHLRLISHEAIGSFNPWLIAESLAEELMAEALSDVAAELQDVCEEYAEAVFTSEFIQPAE